MRNGTGLAAPSGFTLLELSIVLVIIGLIAGGIVVGQEVIRSAALRSVLTDIERYKTSIGTFKAKYSALPGDMMNATKYWGSAGGTGLGTDTDCSSVDTTASQLTCNGNGDGHIGYNSGYRQEWFMAWKQLADAGLVNGSFSDTWGSTSSEHAVPGFNVPTSKLDNAGYTLMHYNSSDIYWFAGDYNNLIVFGVDNGSSETLNPVVRAEEAFLLDGKIDDGLPGKGSVRTYTVNVSACATTANAETAIYDLTQTSPTCSLMFITGY